MRLLIFTFTLVLFCTPAQGATLFVDLDAVGANDGTSWADAWTDLQDALGAATSGDEIWVAEGVYTPTDTDDSGFVFSIPNGVSVYGGFDGTETVLEERDPATHGTVLSGDIGERRPDGEDFVPGQPYTADNSDRVVLFANADDTTLLDGVTVREGVRGIDVVGGAPRIRGAVVRWNHGQNAGGGALIRTSANPSFTDVLFQSNGNFLHSGGGVNSDSGSRPRFERVVFQDNSAGFNGGGMIGTGEFVDVQFIGNRAGEERGGGLSGGGTLTGVLFEDNQATQGGGLFGGGTLTDVTFRGNRAMQFTSLLAVAGGGMAGSGSLTNVVFEDNDAAMYGGGLWSSGGVEMANVLFTGNQSTEGAAFHIGALDYPGQMVPAGDPATAVQLTLADNFSNVDGPVVSVDGTGLSIVNSILADAGASAQIALEDATATVAHSLVEGSGGSGAGWNPAYGTDGGNNLDEDPGFVGGGDVHLAAGSPAIDAGDDGAAAGIATDLDGNARIQGAAVDLGVYEFEGEPGGGEAVEFAAHFAPQTLNVRSNGRWVGVNLWSDGEGDVADIDPSTLLLEGTIPAERASLEDGVMHVKFSRAAVAALLDTDGPHEVTVTGSLFDGTDLVATASLRVIGNGQKGGGPAVALQARPNPFNPSTEITFRLDTSGQVELAIYDLGGRLVKTLRSGDFRAGEHVAPWDGRDASGRSVGSGTYFARLRTASEVRVERLVLVK